MTSIATPFAIVGIYAALNAIIMAAFVYATGTVRRRSGILVGDGGEPSLIRVMRGHANAAENIPLMMAMLVIAAGIGTPPAVLHGLGLVFTVARGLHAWHFMHEKAPMWMRFAGFGVSMLTMLVLALGLLAHGVAVLLHG